MKARIIRNAWRRFRACAKICYFKTQLFCYYVYVWWITNDL